MRLISFQKEKIQKSQDFCEQILVFEKDVPEKTKQKQMIKIHKQFGHASAENLKRLFNNAGKLDKEIIALIDKTLQGCDTCKMYRKANTKPIVGFSWATDFNQTVGMDLHQLEESVWYLHIIDEFIRFSNAIIVRNKGTSTVIKKFLQSWISIFGSPNKVFSDNGGEFESEEFKDMCENFNITFTTTPSYSPWSNDLCERHNYILTETLLKIKEEGKCDWETALAWAINAKNSFINVKGFSPYQLVFGRNVSLPSVVTDKPPALEGSTESHTVAEHLTALHSARKAFVAAESSEKIRRASRRQTRSSGMTFIQGEEVCYKRNDNPRWKGPAKVIGQDGPVVFIRHGGKHIKAHSCRVQLVKERCLKGSNEPRTYTVEKRKVTLNDIEGSNVPHTVEKRKPTINDIEGKTYEDDSDDMEGDSDICDVPDSQSAPEQSQELSTEQVQDSNIETLQRDKSNAESHQTEQARVEMPRKVISKFSNGETVTFSLNGENYTVKILNKAGKAGGKYKNTFNVEYK